MWKVFYQFASPKTFYRQSQVLNRYFSYASLLFFSVGLYFSLFASPPDYQQGETVRMMYIHVPSALLSMLCFGLMGTLALSLLVWRVKLAGILLRSAARVGAGMTALALFTGSLWGKPMWGTWWVWDARLTSEFILLMIYLSILAIQSSFRQEDVAERAMAVLTLVGLIDLPIIHYSVYWWNTLHQGSSFPLFKKPLIDASMLWPLGLMMGGFVCFSAWMILGYARSEVLRRSAGSRWCLQALRENT